jgi:hypothetical protein
VLNILQGEGAETGAHPNLGAGYILPCLHFLKEEFSEFTNGTRPLQYCQPFAEALLKSLDKRLDVFFHLHPGSSLIIASHFKISNLFC